MREDREVTIVESESSGLKWFLIGAAIGASLGVLFAPQAGERTRHDLARGGRKLRARAEEVIDDLGDELQTRGQRIKETVQEMADGVVDEVQGAGRRFERGAGDARDEMERRLARARARARAAVDAAGDAVDDESD